MMTRPPTPPITPARIVGVLLLLLLFGADVGDEVAPPPPAPVVEVPVGEPAEAGLVLEEGPVLVLEEDEEEEIVIGGSLPPSDGSEFCAVVVVTTLALVMLVLGAPGAVYATVKTPLLAAHENARKPE